MSPEGAGGGGGGEPPSYSNVTSNDRVGTRAKRPTFEPSSQLRDQLLAREQGLRKEMDVEPITSHPKASRGWEPDK
jgi:hypothetical protein